MSELRWILLIAGALLIAGIYIWGMQMRRRAAGKEPLRPATFTGGAQSFEVPPDPVDAPEYEVEPAPAVAQRRVEPRMSLDDEADEAPAIERRSEPRPESAEGRSAAAGAAPARTRREPTLTARAEPEVPPWDEPRAESTTATRVEPRIDEPASSSPTGRVEPTLEPRRPASTSRAEAPTPAAASAPVASKPAAAPAVEAKADTATLRRPPQKIFAVRVSASGTGRFTGDRVLEALQSEGLQFGRYEIFHRLHENGRPVLSVASLRDPGTFDLQAMPRTEYPGVLVFAVLPGPVAASEAFDEMLFTARALATHLGGALADEKGQPLTAQRATSLREEALEFERAVAGAA